MGGCGVENTLSSSDRPGWGMEVLLIGNRGMSEVECLLGESNTGLNTSVPSEEPLMARIVTETNKRK